MAVGLGWSPAFDLPEPEGDDDKCAGPGCDHCLKVESAAGLSFDTSTAKGLGLLTCDQFYSIGAALNGNPEDETITAGAVIDSVQQLGAGFDVAGCPAPSFESRKRFPSELGLDDAVGRRVQVRAVGGKHPSVSGRHTRGKAHRPRNRRP